MTGEADSPDDRAGAECIYLTKQKPGLKAGTGETMLKRIGAPRQRPRFSCSPVLTFSFRSFVEALEDSFTAYRTHSDQRVTELEDMIRQYIHNNMTLSTSLVAASERSLGLDRHDPSPLAALGASMARRESIAAGMIDLSTGIAPQHAHVGDMADAPCPVDPMQAAVHAPHPSDYQRQTGPRPHRSPLSRQYQPDSQSNFSPSGMSMLPPNTGNDMQMYPYNSHQLRAEDNPASYTPVSYEPPIWTEGASMPRDDIVQDLIRLFFGKVAPWAFIIISRADKVWEPPWDVVAHAIVVVSLRFSTDDRVRPFRDQIYNAARQHVFIQAMDMTTIETMQALALLAIDVIGSGKGPEHWSALSLLTRAAITMDLLKESDSQQSPDAEAAMTSQAGTMKFPSVLSKTKILPPPVMWQEDEARRRLFWLIFILDRYTCTATAWDIAIPQADIKRRLPCADELWRGTVGLLPQQLPHANVTDAAFRSGFRQTPLCLHSIFTVVHLPHLRLCILLHSSSKHSTSWAEHTLYSQDLSMFRMLAPWRVGRTQRQQSQVPPIAGTMISIPRSVGWRMSSPWSPCIC